MALTIYNEYDFLSDTQIVGELGPKGLKTDIVFRPKFLLINDEVSGPSGLDQMKDTRLRTDDLNFGPFREETWAFLARLVNEGGMDPRLDSTRPLRRKVEPFTRRFVKKSGLSLVTATNILT